MWFNVMRFDTLQYEVDGYLQSIYSKTDLERTSSSRWSALLLTSQSDQAIIDIRLLL